MRILIGGSTHESLPRRAATPPSPSPTTTIAVFTKNMTNPAYEAFRIAADQIARSTDTKVVHFVPKQPDNVDEEQKAMVARADREGPARCGHLHPVDDVAMIELLRSAACNAANIPIVLVSNPLPGKFVTYVGADDFKSDTARPAIYSSVSAARARSSSSRARRPHPPTASAFAAITRRSPSSGIELPAPASATISSPTREKSWRNSSQASAASTPYCPANDSMALGVLEALKVANRTSVVIGINGILPAVKQIEAGSILATVDFNMFKIGCMATRAAVRQLRQEPLPEKVMLPAAEIIDRSNFCSPWRWLTRGPAQVPGMERRRSLGSKKPAV